MFIFVGNVDINFKKSKQKRMQLCESKNDIKQKRQKRSADSCGGWSYVFHSGEEIYLFNLFSGLLLCIL